LSTLDEFADDVKWAPGGASVVLRWCGGGGGGSIDRSRQGAAWHGDKSLELPVETQKPGKMPPGAPLAVRVGERHASWLTMSFQVHCHGDNSAGAVGLDMLLPKSARVGLPNLGF